MNNSSEDKLRTAISLVFAFLIFICISFVFLCIGSRFGIFSERHLDRSIAASQYEENAMAALNDALEEEEAEHGLPNGLLAKQIDKAEFQKVLNANIQAASDGKRTVNDTSAFNKKIKTAINTYLQEQSVKNNKTINLAVEDISQTAANNYETYTSFFFGNYFAKYKAQAMKLFRILLPLSLIFIVVLALVMVKLQTDAGKGWYYIVSSTLGAALVCIICSAAVYFYADLTFPETIAYYENFINRFIAGAAVPFLIIGVAGVVAFFMGLRFIKRHQRKKMDEVYR